MFVTLCQFEAKYMNIDRKDEEKNEAKIRMNERMKSINWNTCIYLIFQ